MYSIWRVSKALQQRRPTYIWMTTELLDDSIVKVAGVAQEATCNVVGVLETIKGLVEERDLGSLLQLQLAVLVSGVDAGDPRVMGGSLGLLDMVLELDDVRAGNGLGVGRSQERSHIVIVDGQDAEQRVGRGNRQQR
jgi:hypothetical protein